MYKFYEKPTTSSLCTLERSAASWNQKRATMSQEVVRRLTNTSRDLDKEQKLEIVEEFVSKLRRSGYKHQQIQDIVKSGVVGFSKKWEPREKPHRSAAETESLRRSKKLLGKTSWFKTRRSGVAQDQARGAGAGRMRPDTAQHEPPTLNRRPNTVLFVERTEGGALIAALRSQETDFNKISLKKVKMVERTGKQVQQILTSPDPWGDELCGRENCLPCAGSTRDRTLCRTSNVVYKTTCKVCKSEGQESAYIGESSRSLHERTAEHLKDYINNKELTHMTTHMAEKHPTLPHPEDAAAVAKVFRYRSLRNTDQHLIGRSTKP